MFRCGDDFVELKRFSLLNRPEQRVVPNDITSLLLQLWVELFVCENTNLDFLTRATRQDASASDVLITLGRVHIQLKNEFHTLWELALLRHLTQLREYILHCKLRSLNLQHLRHGLFSAALGVLLVRHFLGLEGLQNFLTVEALLSKNLVLTVLANTSVYAGVPRNLTHLQLHQVLVQ